MTVPLRLLPLTALAVIGPVAAFGQTTLTTPFAISQLVNTACLFDTMDPAKELPRSHAAFAASGMAKVLQMPTKGIYGDMAGTYFISNLTDDNNIACAGHIAPTDLPRQGYDFLVQQIETQFRLRYGDHIFVPGPENTSWIAKHGDGTKTVMTVSFTPNGGTSVSSIAAVDN